MVLSAPQILTVDQFITRYGDDNRYELIGGELIDMEPTGPHEQVAAFVSRKLNVEIDHQAQPYFVPHRCLNELLRPAYARTEFPTSLGTASNKTEVLPG